MSLRLKFNLLTIAILLLVIALLGSVVYGELKRSARDQAVEKAALLMASAEATRTYTSEFIKPLLKQQLEDRFLPESVPAFAATETVLTLRKKFPELSYKEATLNPTNLRDRATDWETDLINSFRSDWAQKQIVGERMQGEIPVLYVAKPIRITNPGCLSCHNTPASAPSSMIKLYGESNGFGWKMDEIIGAQIVTVPLSATDGATTRTFAILLGALVLLAQLALWGGNFLIGKIEAR